MTPKRLCIALAVFVASAFSACAHDKRTYHWSHYQELLYRMYKDPGAAQPEVQIAKLTQDIDEAQRKGKPIPPGVHVHLGYMHYMAGHPDPALKSFEREQQLYPESKEFVSRLVAGITGKPALARSK